MISPSLNHVFLIVHNVLQSSKEHLSLCASATDVACWFQVLRPTVSGQS